MKDLDNKKTGFRPHPLVIAMATIVVGTTLPNVVNSGVPNDLNIYSPPQAGKKNILVMLDASGGMDDGGKGNAAARSIKEDYPKCKGLNSLSEVSTGVLSKAYTLTQTLTNDTSQAAILWGMPFCDNGSGSSRPYSGKSTPPGSTTATTVTNDFKFSRIDRMKLAMSLLLGNTSLSNDVVMGLGQFPAQTNKTIELTTKAVGDSTNYPTKSQLLYSYYSSSQGLVKERSWGNDVSAKIVVPAAPLDGDQRYKMRVAVSNLGSGGLTPLASALAESGAYMLGTTTAGNTTNLVNAFTFDGQSNGPYSADGFKYSPDTTKKSTDITKYQSPITTTGCNANGIFLLTNAAPTSVPRAEAQQIMRNALGDPTFTCPSAGNFLPTPTGKTDFGWSCIGEFAKRLSSDETKPIKVAVAGFGSNYIPYTQNSNLQVNVSSINALGNPVTRIHYKCNSINVGDQYTFDGNTFSVKTENIQDIKNACNLGEIAVEGNAALAGVGGYGQGGFYPIVSPQNLADAIINFSATLKTSISALNTGTPAIPVDTLNVTQQLPDAYYAQFQPDLDKPFGIWIGNMKKYRIVNNTYQAETGGNVIDSEGLLRSTKDYWSTGGLDGKDATKGGALSRLPVQAEVGRKIYSDRTVSGSTVSPINTSGTALTLIKSNNTSGSTDNAESLRAGDDPAKAYLLNLLGFGVTTPTPPANLTGAAQLRQMGATLNSTPLFFTTKSKIATKASGSGSTRVNIGDYIDRKDYVLFGTNQGLLQVVDAETGVEKFAFLPKEMIDRQKNGFIDKNLQTTSNVGSDLYQGIDGAWSVYANYEANNASNSLKASTLNVYGGMRRGGYNYYALDLKDIETSSPKYLFKVGPQQSVSTTGALSLTGTCSNTAPLDCMGQSWSKPTIAWIKWKGKPQLVMIVGGGYDPQYDSETFKTTTATRGNGVYIFAAAKAKTASGSNDSTMPEPGALLWWGSSSATTAAANDSNDTRKTNNDNLKYSVVSEIKAIDRDSDGFVDNLYFGDLGGQVFRVDIDNASSGTFTSGDTTSTKNMVVKRIQRIANFITDADRATKVAPRFYNMPTFTVHSINASSTANSTTTSYTLDVRGSATRFAVIGIGSGDTSNPVKNSLTTATGIVDRVYGIFDRDVGRHDLYKNANDSDTGTGATATTDGLRSKDITTTNMVDLAATGTSAPTVENMVATTNHGWYHTLSGTGLGRSNTATATNIDSNLTGGVARYKVLSSFAAIKNTLFTSYFDAADNGSSSSCSAGVKGRSYIKNYCLPFGSMGSNGENCGTTGTGADGRAYSSGIGSDVGAGIVPVVVGGMTNNQIGPITGAGRDSGVKAGYTTPIRFEPITWYTKRS